MTEKFKSEEERMPNERVAVMMALPFLSYFSTSEAKSQQMQGGLGYKGYKGVGLQPEALADRLCSFLVGKAQQ
eukprot:1137007-Pelagomonas_calceolata.AAC.2